VTSAAEEQLARRFELRIARAEALAQTPSSGREPLQFAAGLFRAQAQAAAAVLEVHRRKAALVGSPEADLSLVERPLRGMLRFLAEGGPLTLRETAAARAAEPLELLASRLRTAWSGGPDERQDFI